MKKIFFTVPEKLMDFIWRFKWLFWILLLACFGMTGLEIHALDLRIEKMTSVWIFFYVPVAIGLFILMFIAYSKKLVQTRLPLYGYILSLYVSTYISYMMTTLLRLNFIKNNIIMFSFMANVILLFFLINVFIAFGFGKIFQKSFDKYKFISALLVSAAGSFIIFLYIPAELFFNNYSDFGFPYQLLVRAFIGRFLYFTFLIPLFFAIFKKKAFYPTYFLSFGFVLALYIQYMFMNRNIGVVDGSSFDWSEHAVLAILDLIIWLVLTIGLFILGLIKSQGALTSDKAKINITTGIRYACTFLLLLHAVTYTTIIVQADKACFNYSATYFTFDEQYAVGSKENILFIILDGADEEFLDNLVAEKSDRLVTFKDFTAYTNALSVYDFTNMSILQMVTNYEFDNSLNGVERRKTAWTNENCVEFFKRFHDNGYKVNFFNFDQERSKYVIGKIDNAVSFNPEVEDVYYINYKSMRRATSELLNYTLFPTIFKGGVNLASASYSKVINYRPGSGYAENIDFYNNLHLTMGSNDKYLIYQHLEGLHEPDNTMEMMYLCMDLLEEYFNQLKELGLYDNATIIVTADHGQKDRFDAERFGTTPMFVVKRSGETHDDIQFNDAPIYHTDIQATLLECAGLYDETVDQEIFGKPIFAYKEGDVRERTWYDRYFDKNYPNVGTYNTLYGYTFTGNTEDFKNAVLNDKGLTIYPVPMQNE